MSRRARRSRRAARSRRASRQRRASARDRLHRARARLVHTRIAAAGRARSRPCADSHRRGGFRARRRGHGSERRTSRMRTGRSAPAHAGRASVARGNPARCRSCGRRNQVVACRQCRQSSCTSGFALAGRGMRSAPAVLDFFRLFTGTISSPFLTPSEIMNDQLGYSTSQCGALARRASWRRCVGQRRCRSPRPTSIPSAIRASQPRPSGPSRPRQRFRQSCSAGPW